MILRYSSDRCPCDITKSAMVGAGVVYNEMPFNWCSIPEAFWEVLRRI